MRTEILSLRRDSSFVLNLSDIIFLRTAPHTNRLIYTGFEGVKADSL